MLRRVVSDLPSDLFPDDAQSGVRSPTLGLYRGNQHYSHRYSRLFQVIPVPFWEVYTGRNAILTRTVRKMRNWRNVRN